MIWMGVIPLTTSLILGYLGLSYVEGIRNFEPFQMLMFWGISIFILGLGIFPTTFFALFSGYMWGLKVIFPIAIVYFFASLLGYCIAKLIKGDFILAFLKRQKKAGNVLNNVQQNSIYWVFLVRISPLFPFAITNTLLAYLHVNLRSYLIGGTLGMIPRSILAIWVGSQAATWQEILKNPNKMDFQNVFTLILLLLSGLGMFYLIRKKSIIPPNP
jgi:uncharacterized membrane protein YdjX (TVP38/TMEM64 family)